MVRGSVSLPFNVDLGAASVRGIHPPSPGARITQYGWGR
jgi:hypothetical protein